MRLLFSLVLVMLITPSMSYAQGMDFSGMKVFWGIMETLEKDIFPSDEMWEELFSTPGYITGNEHEFTHSYFKKYYTLAYMPSKEKELEIELQKSSFYTPYLQHIVNVKKNKANIIEKQKELESSDEIFDHALEKVKKYLPETVAEKYPKPTIAFMIFGPDGRGYETILVDLVYFLQNYEQAVGFMAHEMHHYYLHKESALRDGEIELLWVIRQIYAEGLADQIDKKENFFGKGASYNSDRAMRFRQLVEESPDVVRQIDKLMQEMVISPEHFKRNALRISGVVPQSGHPTGYYMVNVITGSSGPDCLVEDFGNPFSFFRRYNDIARASNGEYPAFCDESMELIGELETKYAK